MGSCSDDYIWLIMYLGNFYFFDLCLLAFLLVSMYLGLADFLTLFVFVSTVPIILMHIGGFDS